jgi:hypothetical protein
MQGTKATSDPVLTFAFRSGILDCECQNQRITSKYKVLVRLSFAGP